MEEFKKKALNTFPNALFQVHGRHLGTSWELQAFTDYINSDYRNMKFTRDDHTLKTHWSFWTVQWPSEPVAPGDRSLQETHTTQYLLFDSNHPFQAKLLLLLSGHLTMKENIRKHPHFHWINAWRRQRPEDSSNLQIPQVQSTWQLRTTNTKPSKAETHFNYKKTNIVHDVKWTRHSPPHCPPNKPIQAR